MGTPSAPGTHSDEGRARITGVEEALPPGESLVWEGQPDVKTLAFRVLYLRAILVYWALIGAGFLAAGAVGGRASGNLAADLVWLMVVAAIGSALIFGFAAAIRSSTTYALTDRRVVIRMGVAFPSVLNLPLHQIDSVDVRATGRDRDGREVGDLVLTPSGDARVGWLYLWPHVKPWAWKDPLPAFRALPEAASVGAQVARHAKERLDEARARGEDSS
jgi:hypothetical protein